MKHEIADFCGNKHLSAKVYAPQPDHNIPALVTLAAGSGSCRFQYDLTADGARRMALVLIALADQIDSGKDGVAAFAHAGGVGQLIFQPKGEKRLDDGDEFTHAKRLDAPINLAGLVSNADDHGVPAATGTGIFREGGKDFCIVGAQAFSLDDLRLQGVLSGSDVGEIAYVLKYLRKALAGSDAAECVSKAVAFTKAERAELVAL